MENLTELAKNNSHTSLLVKEAFEKVQKRVSIKQLLEGVWDENYKFKLSEILNFFIFRRIGLVVITEKLYRELEVKFLYDDFEKWCATETMRQAISDPAKFDEVYAMWADNASRELFDWLIKYRVAFALIGKAAEGFFPFTADFNHQTFLAAQRSAKKRGSLYEVNGYLIESWYLPVYEAWGVGSYVLEGRCEPAVGDVVISAGAYCGESSIWLADRVGDKGKVYAFEPSARYVPKIKNNIQRNSLGERIQVVAKGLWKESASMNFSAKGTSGFCNDEGNSKVDVVAIDDFVESEGLKKLDLIKMDIEGAELNALKGAAAAITRFKPKLMICLYHLPEDITEIPAYIKSLVPEYQIYLSHKFGNWYHTILFATVK
jgi:FkbM family methyltransferase